MKSIESALLVAMAVAGCAVSEAHEATDLTGAQLYQQFCASCHGVRARGDGPVAPTMKLKVPDLTRIASRNGGTYPTERVRQTIDGQQSRPAHGAPGMPVWGWELYAVKGEDEPRRQRVTELVGRLVDYLASVQRQ